MKSQNALVLETHNKKVQRLEWTDTLLTLSLISKMNRRHVKRVKTHVYNQSNLFELVAYLYCLAGMTAIICKNGRNCLEDLPRVSPGHHQTEEAGTGQRSDGLSRWVIGSCAPNRGLQQQLEKRLWQSKTNGWKVGHLRKQLKCNI